MHAVLDTPTSAVQVDPRDFAVRGWIWIADAQPSIASIEAWNGDVLLGKTDRLELRPDVSSTVGLPAGARTGFSFRAHHPQAAATVNFDLHLQVRLFDGTRMGPFCWTHVRVGARTGETEREAAGSGCAQNVDDPLRAQEKIERLEREVTALRAQLAQPVDPVPPEHLQRRQTGYVLGPLFLPEGKKLTEAVIAAVAESGRPLESCPRILDFGCGCGRVLWGLRDFGADREIWGTDIDREAIAWNRAHLGHIAQFSVNGHLPPTAFRDAYFDAVFSISVFTHLPEEMQFAWLAEVRRLVKPGGVFVASIHGAHYWQNSHPLVKAEVEARGFDYRAADRTEGLPEFYMVAFHSEAYIRQRWGRFFEVLAVKERFFAEAHDAVIMRRRED